MKTAAACAALFQARDLFANPLGLPVGLQLYSVRDFLPKDYDGTLKQVGAIGYQEVEAAGFYGHSAADVKSAMKAAGLHLVSSHYPLQQLKPQLDQSIDFGKQLGLDFMICSSPMMQNPERAKGLGWGQAMDAMTLDDWKWNAEQFNQIGEKVKAAGMRFGYHNHFFEFHKKDGVVPYDVLLKETDPKLVHMEMDCGWVVVGGASPEHYLTEHANRFAMLHVKEFKLQGWTPGQDKVPVSTELGHGSIDYKKIFAAAKNAPIQHIFVEQEQYPDMPAMQALKADADWMKAFPG